MPLKQPPLRQYCSLQYNIFSFITLITPLYRQMNEDLAVCWSSFILANNIPREVFTWQRDVILLTAWPKYFNYSRRVKLAEGETERGARMETMLKSFWVSLTHLRMANSRSTRWENLSDESLVLSRYGVQLFHISGYNLYANIRHIAPFKDQCDC